MKITVSVDGSSKIVDVPITTPAGRLILNGKFTTRAAWNSLPGCGIQDQVEVPNQNYHYRGLISWIGQFQGQQAIMIDIGQPPSYPPSGGPGGWWGAANLGSHPGWGVGAEWWVGQSLWVPPSGLNISLTSAPNVGELYDGVGGQPTIGLMLQKAAPMAIKITPAFGLYNPAAPYNGSVFQYNQFNLPKLYAIPPGGLVNGAWNSFIVHMLAKMDSTVQLDTWCRASGSAWQPVSSLRGYPTMKWDSSGVPVSNPQWNGPSCYAKAMASASDPDTVLYFGAGLFFGTTFDVVAACLP